MSMIDQTPTTIRTDEAKNPMLPAPWWNDQAMAWEVLESRLAMTGRGICAVFDLVEAQSDGVLFALHALERELGQLRGEIRQVLHVGPEAAQ
ncbi:hypothetical protein [Acidocella sp.]|uniref:hypothetical protein n=1 Tax=Acidocella sp. TaxID=50710 RepID=UPI0026225744|nr:hypothetical protein [Acidocella sp.]